MDGKEDGYEERKDGGIEGSRIEGWMGKKGGG